MKNPILNIVAIFVILSGLVLTVPVTPALADSCDGDDGNNSIDCLSNPDDNNVIGGGGDDAITVGAAVDSSPEVMGDGLEAENVVGGNDTINIAGTAGNVAGDGLTGANDTSATGGNDNIVITGTAADVQGDGGFGASAQGGNDVIEVSGTAGHVEGDGMGATGTMTAGNDTLTVDNATSVSGDGGGGQVSYGGDDIINATAPDVCGDGVGGLEVWGGNDMINATGTYINGDCLNGPDGTTLPNLAVGGNDVITATASESVSGDSAQGVEVWGGNDTITATSNQVSGDELQGTDLAVGGDDVIVADANTICGDCISPYNPNPEFSTANGTSFEAYGGNDTITLPTGAEAEDVSGDGLSGDHLYGGDDNIFIFGSSNSVAGDGADNGLTAEGGDDVIVVNGDVANDVNGDRLWVADSITGGNDTIVINGSADMLAGDGGGALYAEGGNDTIEVNGFVRDVNGDGLWESQYANGGNDVLTINDAQYVHGDGIQAWDVHGGNDQIALDGTAEYVAGDGLWDATRAEGGDDTITINGVAQGVGGDSILAVVSDEFQSVESAGIYGGNDTIVINGVAQAVGGDSIWVVASESFQSAESAGIYGGNDTIVINGTVLGDVWGDDIPDYGFGGNDNIVINGYVSGNVDADGLYPTNGALSAAEFANGATVHGGNDTVTIGAGGVSYGTVCQDIPVTLVNYTQGRVGGVIDGSQGSDTLNFAVLATDGGVIDALNARLDGLNPGGGSVNVGGQDYSFANFENLNVSPIYFGQGPTRLFDDGVVLAFGAKNGNGIDVCSGPKGWRVGTIDFAQLEANATNQVFSSGNEGWYLTVNALGNGQYGVNVYNGQGALQNDKFTFVHK